MIQLLIKGGWVMVPLVICSITAITVIIERFLFFRRIAAASQAENMLSLVRLPVLSKESKRP